MATNIELLWQQLRSTSLSSPDGNLTESLPFRHDDDSYLQPAPHSPIPRYLYRVSTPRSYCYTDAEWVKSRDSWMCRPGGHQNIFQAADPTVTAQNIHRHLNWRFSPEDNLVSWTSSLLFAIQFAFYRHASPTDSSSFGTIKICVVDTTLFEDGVFTRDMDLIRAFEGLSPELAAFGVMRRRTKNYFGEYLSQGALKIEGKCSLVSFQAMIDAGLLKLRDEFQASNESPKQELAKKIVELRGELFDPSTKHLCHIPQRVPIATAIGNLFHEPFRLPVTIHLVSLCPGCIDDETIASYFEAEDFSDAARDACARDKTRLVPHPHMQELVRARDITDLIYFHSCVRGYRDVMDRAEELLAQREEGVLSNIARVYHKCLKSRVVNGIVKTQRECLDLLEQASKVATRLVNILEDGDRRVGHVQELDGQAVEFSLVLCLLLNEQQIELAVNTTKDVIESISGKTG